MAKRIIPKLDMLTNKTGWYILVGGVPSLWAPPRGSYIAAPYAATISLGRNDSKCTEMKEKLGAWLTYHLLFR